MITRSCAEARCTAPRARTRRAVGFSTCGRIGAGRRERRRDRTAFLFVLLVGCLVRHHRPWVEQCVDAVRERRERLVDRRELADPLRRVARAPPDCLPALRSREVDERHLSRHIHLNVYIQDVALQTRTRTTHFRDVSRRLQTRGSRSERTSTLSSWDLHDRVGARDRRGSALSLSGEGGVIVVPRRPFSLARAGGASRLRTTPIRPRRRHAPRPARAARTLERRVTTRPAPPPPSAAAPRCCSR